MLEVIVARFRGGRSTGTDYSNEYLKEPFRNVSFHLDKASDWQYIRNNGHGRVGPFGVLSTVFYQSEMNAEH